MVKNPSGGTVHALATYTAVGVIGYLGYSYGLQGHLGTAVQEAMQAIHDTFFPGKGSGGDKFKEACAAARAQLIALDGRWAAASCDQIKAEVCANPTLFVGQTDIRGGLGCSS